MSPDVVGLELLLMELMPVAHMAEDEDKIVAIRG